MIGGHDTFGGVEAIADFIERVQALAPVGVTRTSRVDAQGGWLRYHWRATNSEQVTEGLDVAELAEDGRLQRLIVFHPLQLPAA
jgi:hypothetical protein